MTGNDDEWNLVDPKHGTYQNKRLSSVFKQHDVFDGQPYDIDGIVFYDLYKDADGNEQKSYFTDSKSCVPITFPYTQEIIYKQSE